jgi:monoamine oxidase
LHAVNSCAALFALSGASAAASALPALAALPDTGPRLHVVIVGAGLAGLVSAYELEKRGHRVTILEADARIYFAGEHASLTHTWMQGALESGLRATREMLEAAQKT